MSGSWSVHKRVADPSYLHTYIHTYIHTYLDLIDVGNSSFVLSDQKLDFVFELSHFFVMPVDMYVYVCMYVDVYVWMYVCTLT